jgi:protein-S-isoprenylcysteine O-methyltransferase Ste14
LFRACRQPVYLAFALTLWTGPVLTLDRLVLAVAWTAYSLVGPLFKERRYVERFVDAYRNYQAQVPYMLPGRSGRHELAD